MTFDIRWPIMYLRRPLTEEDPQWKTYFNRRKPSMNFDGRQYLVEDNLEWKTTLEDSPLWNMTLMKDKHGWKRTFDLRQPLMEDKMEDILCMKPDFD